MSVGIASIVVGIFILAAIGFRWEWFVNHYKVRGAFKKFGKTGAIIIYVAWGLIFVAMGTLMLLGIIRFE